MKKLITLMSGLLLFVGCTSSKNLTATKNIQRLSSRAAGRYSLYREGSFGRFDEHGFYSVVAIETIDRTKPIMAQFVIPGLKFDKIDSTSLVIVSLERSGRKFRIQFYNQNGRELYQMTWPVVGSESQMSQSRRAHPSTAAFS